MELCFTSNFLITEQAEKYSLMSSVYYSDVLLDKTVEMGFVIGPVNMAYELSFKDWLLFEWRLFHSLLYVIKRRLVCNGCFDMSLTFKGIAAFWTTQTRIY